jgi:hypothetical protein
MHSVDCVEGNAKPGVKFWGAIADTYNSTTDAHRQRTPNNLKDHGSTYKGPPTTSKCLCSIKSTIKNIPTGKAEPTMPWFSRPQRSDTRIGLDALNSSASTSGKLRGINSSVEQSPLAPLQLIHGSPQVTLRSRRR